MKPCQLHKNDRKTSATLIMEDFFSVLFTEGDIMQIYRRLMSGQTAY